MEIKVDHLNDSRVIKFLRDHLAHMIEITPPGYVYALDIDSLKRPEITFWTVWDLDTLVCCGALKELDGQHAELKSMRTAPSHLGRGIASYLLTFILSEAKRRKFRRVSLETGCHEPFRPARNLNEKFGFTYCPPFADYTRTPHNVFMTIYLSNDE